ncbi:hypothetical protein J5N97_021012 [Dioscorea zingiberensis]|uniref:AN1-type domain-containing protein n=1 Tax=Dioscorea zingiberensis TaxID=325984 RepID=A0A9D5HEA0_9LILI|nr:hypothetical protein J5N97_021012 [Dioscorea zingiberensis]
MISDGGSKWTWDLLFLLASQALLGCFKVTAFLEKFPIKMAQESCNLDKDEAEILKPSPSSAPPPTSSSPPSIFHKATLEHQILKPDRPNTSRVLKPSRGPLSSARLGNRCSTCQKRVGLTGFRCRCGDLFCASHRYSDTHDCSFDYKALGREEISKANPVIRAAKIIKI